MRCHKLQSQGKFFAIAVYGTERNRERRNPNKICGNRENIRKIHGKRVIAFLPDLKCGRGSCRRCDNINFVERMLKILADQITKTPCYVVVCVIISRRENIGPQQYSPAHFSPESFPSSFSVIFKRCCAFF